MTLWELLGVKNGCPSQELTAAYRKTCKELHPDKTGNDEKKTKLFVSMNLAYEKELERRRIYGIDPGFTAPAGTAEQTTSSNSVNWNINKFFSTHEMYGIYEQMQKEGLIGKKPFKDFEKERRADRERKKDILRGGKK